MYPMSFLGVSRGLAAFLVLISWTGASLLHGCLFVLPGLCVHFAKKTRSRLFCGAVFAASFVLTEWITELSDLAFPWVRLSAGQFRAPVLLQSAAVFGAYGTDLLILLVNVLLALVILYREKKRILAGAFAASLFLSNLGFGALRMGILTGKGETVEIAAVQGSILSGDKWEEGGTQHCLDVYTALTEDLPDGMDLVIWPETAVPVDLSRSWNEDVLQSISDLSENIGAPILVGTFWTRDGESINAAAVITKQEVSEPYAKRHLVPFGEAVPYRALFETVFPFLKDISLLSDDLVAGTEATVFETPAGNCGAVICFESIFPDLVRDSVKGGAEVLVIVTNDSWFKDSPGVYQHLSHAVLRSIENGRSTVRAANSGVSAIIDPCGAITAELGPLEKGVVTWSVALSDNNTLYTRTGNVILPAALLAVAVWAVVLALGERRRHDRKQ